MNKLRFRRSADDGYQSIFASGFETTIDEEAEEFGATADFIRITDEH